MCCVVASLFALGPRAAILIWWLVEPVRWGAAFDTFVWPFIGFLILPWTTLMYVLVYPGGRGTRAAIGSALLRSPSRTRPRRETPHQAAWRGRSKSSRNEATYAPSRSRTSGERLGV